MIVSLSSGLRRPIALVSRHGSHHLCLHPVDVENILSFSEMVDVKRTLKRGWRIQLHCGRLR
jgi:hypothetical protein